MTKRKPPHRQIFVLTPDEKKAVACVIGAFVLGLATMQYRATHPRPSPPPTAKEERAAKKAAKAATARARSARGATKNAHPTPAPPPAEEEER